MFNVRPSRCDQASPPTILKMDREADIATQFHELVSAFRAKLEWEYERGRRWITVSRSEPSHEISNAILPIEDLSSDHRSHIDGDEHRDESVTVKSRAVTLDAVRRELGDCQRCRLASERTHLVFGVGSETANLMFIGEAPGFHEDQQGEPFVGQAGQLLTKMIVAMGLTRDEVYICNIIKCRPPNNRNPLDDELNACEPFLRKQIDCIKPRLMIALGNYAAKALLRTDLGITKLRGEFYSYQGIPLMPTFHPAYLLRNPAGKRLAWNDLQKVMAEMDRLQLPRRNVDSKKQNVE